MVAVQDPSPPSTLVISGVDGQAAHRLNGDYILMEQVSEGKPVWGKSPPNGLQIACVRWGWLQSEYWCVRETASNKKTSNKMYLMWAPTQGAFPDEVAGDWTVVDKCDIVVQSGVSVKVGGETVAERPQQAAHHEHDWPQQEMTVDSEMWGTRQTNVEPAYMPFNFEGPAALPRRRSRGARRSSARSCSVRWASAQPAGADWGGAELGASGGLEDASRWELRDLRDGLRAVTAERDALQAEAAALRAEVQRALAAAADAEGRFIRAEADAQGVRGDLAAAREELSKAACRQELTELRTELLDRTAQRDALQSELDSCQAWLCMSEAEVAAVRGELADAREQLNKALACREQSSSWCAAGAQWEYEYGGEWHGFGLEASHLLLQAYTRYLMEYSPASVEVNSGGVQREVEFWSMQQVNKDTGVRRMVRLNLNVPTSWGGPCQLLAAGQDHWQAETDPTVLAEIAALMRATAHGRSRAYLGSTCCDMANLRLVRVYRVENVDLWLKYVGHARHLGTSASLSRHSCGQLSTQALVGTLGIAARGHVASLSMAYPLNERLNEVWLFHGTEGEAARRITSSGFDARVSNQGLYGWGTYFSSQSCKSHQYAKLSLGGVHTIILSRVLLGCPHYATMACRHLVRPPDREDAPALRHDSVIANPGTVTSIPTWGAAGRIQAHQEVVIYENALQAYPSYVIEYTVV